MTTESNSEALELSQYDLEVRKMINEKIWGRYENMPVAFELLKGEDIDLGSVKAKIPETGWTRVDQDKYVNIEQVSARVGLTTIKRILSVDETDNFHFGVSITSDDPEFIKEEGRQERETRLMEGEIKNIFTDPNVCEIEIYGGETLRFAPIPTRSEQK